jgi:acid phosphatase
MLSALHLFDDDTILPTTYVKTARKWKTSQVTPMGGRVIFERIRCPQHETSQSSTIFVRVNVNDGIVAIPDCDVREGLCPLDEFVALLRRYEQQTGDFRTVCNVPDHLPDHITFLHQ